MQKIFRRYITFVVSISLMAILLLNCTMQLNDAKRQAAENAELKLAQIAQTLENNDVDIEGLKDSLREDYLTRAYAFAYIIQQNPDVLNRQSEMEKIAELLNVDELHVIDENGILFAGSITKYFGMDFKSTEQTREFLSILDDQDSYLVQDIRPNGYEQKVFQYIGVARQDQKGIVQVGMAPTRMLEAQKRNELEYIFSRVPVDEGSVLFAVDKECGTILAHTDSSKVGKKAEEIGIKSRDISLYEKGDFSSDEEKKMFYVMRDNGNLILGLGQTREMLYRERNVQIFMTFIGLLLISLIMIILINWLLKRQIVDGVHAIMDDLSHITEGNLDTVVHVDSNPEFRKLSAGINKMVQGILNATVKVSRVIDIVDLPVGVFEFSQDGSKVMATDRVRMVMNWTEEEMERACKDRSIFEKMLKKEVEDALEKEGNIYKICHTPERWVKIYLTEENGSIFGIVSDVTKDMLEKRKIEHERDYDSLTGLCNMDVFRRQVERILSGENPGNAAVIMLDLDWFKGINDKYGHDWGDKYLCICADFLKEFNDDRGIAARRSGDEFCIFLHHYESRDAIIARIEGFYSTLGVSTIPMPDGDSRIMQISAGLAWYREDLKDFSQLLKAADYALYDAKNSGRGRWKQYSLM